MPSQPTCPMSRHDVIDKYFLEHRAKVIDIAAFLDRIDRCKPEEKDHRVEALLACIQELCSDQPNRAERVLRILSDQSCEPIERAGGKGACGAPDPVVKP